MPSHCNSRYQRPRNFSGSTKLIVVKFFDSGEEKYHGYLTNDYEESEAQIIDESRCAIANREFVQGM